MTRRLSISKRDQEAYIDMMAALDNGSLLRTVIEEASGDDYDAGCFTPNGAWYFDVALVELKKRLVAARWLSDEFKW